MRKLSPKRPEHLFVVRLWHEGAGAPAVPWRGLVEHVASGQRRYFGALADLQEFISAHLASGDGADRTETRPLRTQGEPTAAEDDP